MSEFQIQGLAGVVEKLRALGPKLEKKALGAALRKGAAVVRKAAVMRARQFDRPETPANISKEIVVRTNAKLGRQNGGVAVQVGVKGGAKQYRNNKANRRGGRAGGHYEGPGNVFWWRFLEFGTSKMRAQPFMSPALRDNVDQVTTVIVAELNTQIDKLAGKA